MSGWCLPLPTLPFAGLAQYGRILFTGEEGGAEGPVIVLRRYSPGPAATSDDAQGAKDTVLRQPPSYKPSNSRMGSQEPTTSAKTS